MKLLSKRLTKLSWKVFYYDFNQRKIGTYDVFKHSLFTRDVAEAYKTINNLSEFKTQLHSIIGYYFWGKCEYEMIVSAWPPTKDRAEEIKIDISDQLRLNFDIFAQYVWDTLTSPTK